MRTLLALILSWLMPARGKRRRPAEGLDSVEPITADSPTRRLIISRDAVGVGRPALFIEVDGLPLVRPYLIAHEREQERRRQKDRRTALTLATLGIDFHGVAV
ncbi:hypothetical protein ACFYQA_05690 [Streptomyces sp. NPDC005774]|uniref:hypothetical protein n=1 Tax=Streptomyces sp. NPDC005774 TaxID=3364728 RepID=UPI003689BBA4